MRNLLLLVALAGCTASPPLCARMCGEAGVEKWLNVSKAYEMCLCKNGEAHVEFTKSAEPKSPEVPREDGQSAAEHQEELRETAAKAFEAAKSDAVRASEELEQAAEELFGGK